MSLNKKGIVDVISNETDFEKVKNVLEKISIETVEDFNNVKTIKATIKLRYDDILSSKKIEKDKIFSSYKTIQKEYKDIEDLGNVLNKIVSSKLANYIEQHQQNEVSNILGEFDQPKVILDTKGLNKRKEITIEVVDITKVPPQFLKPIEINESEIKKAFKQNRNQIDGLKIEERLKVS